MIITSLFCTDFYKIQLGPKRVKIIKFFLYKKVVYHFINKSSFSLYRILNTFLTFPACEPKMMPTYPQHRNMKSSKSSNSVNPPPPPSVSSIDTGSMDQTMNLPAITDLVSNLRLLLKTFLPGFACLDC